MSRRFTVVVGIMLILVGLVGLVLTLIVPLLGFDAWWAWGAWQLWPLGVIGAGILFVTMPLLLRGKRGLGALFIPGVPILVSGALVLYANTFDRWQIWSWLWPLEVLGLAAGFLLAAIHMRVIWLLLPALLIGANGALMQFCALTGFWQSWAVLWTIEPLAIGVAFLVINLRQRARGLFIAGVLLWALAALGTIGMSALFPRWILINALGPALLLGLGLLMLIHSLGSPGGQSAQEAPA